MSDSSLPYDYVIVKFMDGTVYTMYAVVPLTGGDAVLQDELTIMVFGRMTNTDDAHWYYYPRCNVRSFEKVSAS